MQGEERNRRAARCVCACAAAARHGSGDTRRALPVERVSRSSRPRRSGAPARRCTPLVESCATTPTSRATASIRRWCAGIIEYVQRAIAARPEIAREKGGPKGSYGAAGMTYVVDATGAAFPKWEPLLYLCFTRLENPASNDNALAIAKLLLDNGADPNSYFMAGGSSVLATDRRDRRRRRRASRRTRAATS